MGKIFVIDGTDGSGKQTQLEMLKNGLKDRKIEYKAFSFPNYDSLSSSLVKMYLAGDFGKEAKDVNPYVASTFYAVDRYATYKKEIEEYYNKGEIILLDRYTTANMVHQSGKISNYEERKKFLDWLWNFEFNLFELPIPDKVFFLNMPPEFALKLMKDRANKITNKEEKDIHESDKNHIINSYNAACTLVKDYNWYEVKCVKNNEIRSIENIHEEILNEVLKNI